MHLIIYLRNSIVFVYQARSDARYVDKHKRWREGVNKIYLCRHKLLPVTE